MGLKEKRVTYKPFEYPEVMSFVDRMNQTFWVHSEVDFTADIQDYLVNLTDTEREIVKRSALAIAQVEVAVKTFWGDIYKHFPKPEINNVGATFAESECFDESTEILTSKGFKYLKDVTKEDKVAGYNIEDKSIIFEHPIRIINRSYEGIMHHYFSKGLDLMVTPNHEIIVEHPTSHKVSKKKSIEGIWGGNYKCPVSGYKRGSREFTFLDRLLIAIQADGSLFGCTPTGKEAKRMDFCFTLYKKRKQERLRWILESLNIEYRERDINNGGIVFNASLKGLVDFEYIGKIKTFSYIDLEDIDSDWGNEFIEELKHWDCSNKSNYSSYYNSREEAVDRVFEICCLSGYRACKALNRSAEQSLKNLTPDGKVRKSSKDCYVLTIFKSDKTTYPMREEVYYSGNVYCVEVPSGNIIVRRNKRACVSGNCRHSESYARVLEVLNLENEFENLMKVPAFERKYRILDEHYSPLPIEGQLLFFTLVIENASLFSQFANIVALSHHKGLMKNISNMISWTCIDEDCFPYNTQVLTPSGWRDIELLFEGDEVYGYKAGELKIEQVRKRTCRNDETDWVKIYNNKGFFKCTPAHNLILNKDGVWGKEKAGNITFGKDIRIPVVANYTQKSKILTPDERMKLLFALLKHNTRGYIYNDNDNWFCYYRGGKIVVGIRNAVMKIDFEAILNSTNIVYTTKDMYDKDNNFTHTEFVLDWAYIDTLFDVLHPLKMKEYSKVGLEQILDIILRWFSSDGETIYLSSYESVVQLQILGILAGYKVTIINRNDPNISKGYEVRFEVPTDMTEPSEGWSVVPEKTLYSQGERAYCISVPSGGLIIKDANKENHFIVSNCHADFGIWLINKLVEEGMELDTDVIHSSVKAYIEYEKDLLDWIYEKGEFEWFSKEDMLNFMKYRLDLALTKIGVPKAFNVTEEQYKKMYWFDEFVYSNTLTDFFAQRPTDYTKHNKSFTENDLF